MTRTRRLWLALVVVFALGAITAGAASAAKPEWKYCKKPPSAGAGKGEYETKACTTPTGTKAEPYELEPGIGKGKGFKGKGGEVSLHTVVPGTGDVPVHCVSFKITGSVVAPSGVANVTVELKKCTVLLGTFSCTTAGAKNGVIKTAPMAGSLGYLDFAHTEAGVSLTSEAAPGTGYLAKFKCGSYAEFRVFGWAIGKLLPFGVISKEPTLTFTVGAYLGTPSPGYTPLVNPPGFEFTGTKYEEPVDTLLTERESGSGWEPPGGAGWPSGLEGKANMKGESLEVN
jgi:hypothetical protein